MQRERSRSPLNNRDGRFFEPFKNSANSTTGEQDQGHFSESRSQAISPSCFIDLMAGPRFIKKKEIVNSDANSEYWRQEWHQKRVLVFGDSRVRRFRKYAKPKMYTGNCVPITSMEILTLKNDLLEYLTGPFPPEPYQLLMVVLGHCDFSQKVYTKEYPDFTLIGVESDEFDMPNYVQYIFELDQFFKKEFPLMKIMWSLPAIPDLLQFNQLRVCNYAKKHPNQCLQPMSKELADTCLYWNNEFNILRERLLQCWQPEEAGRPLIFDLQAIGDPDRTKSTEDGVHPNRQASHSFWLALYDRLRAITEEEECN